MKTLSIHGVRLAVEDQGTGLPLLLVHGFPLDHTMWDAQLEVLSRRCRVIAPDLRGFGQSGVTEGSVTMEQFADDLDALLDALAVAEPIALCGLSMGGYIALAFWRKHRSRLRGLVLCDTKASADTPEAAAARRETAGRVLREGPALLADSMLPKLVAPATLDGRPEIVAAVRRVILAADPRGIAAAQRGMAERPDSSSLLPQIDCPALLLGGQHDVLSPPDQMRAMAGEMPQARFVTIADAGHLAPLENPAKANLAMLEFLGRVGVTGK